MTRRSFVTLLATLAAWVSMRPKLHADAVNASSKPAKPSDWHPSDDGKVLIKVWDRYLQADERFVRSVYMPSPYGRILGFRNDAGDLTRFRLVAVDEVEENGRIATTAHYDYESGPKWWVERILERPNLFDDLDEEVGLRNGSTIRFGGSR